MFPLNIFNMLGFLPSLYIVFLDSSLGLKKYEELPDGFYHLPSLIVECGGKEVESVVIKNLNLPKFCSLHESEYCIKTP